MKRLSKDEKKRWLAYAERVADRRLRSKRITKNNRRRKRSAQIAAQYVGAHGLATEYARLKRLRIVNRPWRSGATTLRYPPIFSFIEDPEQAIEATDRAVRAILARHREITFDQTDCKFIDLCAASVLNALMRDAEHSLKTDIVGVLPKDPLANEIVRATGLPSALEVTGVTDPPKIYRHFKLTKGHSHIEGTNRPSFDKGLYATKLTTYFGTCLKQYGVKLTEAGEHYLGELIGEVIDNAERHSRTSHWWVAGYLREDPKKGPGDCHIVIFNVGRTIAESLRELPSDSSLRLDIEALTRKHRGAGMFQREPWSEDSLWTLYALQQGVSRKNTQKPGEELGNNGQGTIKMIRWFFQLGKRVDGKHIPKMAVVSGRTFILFDGRYQLVDQNSGQLDQPRKVITFNSQGTLEVAPDPACVRSLRNYFPGTIISLRFYLDRDHLRNFTHEHRTQNQP